MADSVKALTFDVFGTLVDWYTSIAHEGQQLEARTQVTADWHQFALDWRAGYGPALQQVNQGELPWQPMDDIHRRLLDGLLPRYGLRGLTEGEIHHFNLAWHRLQAWPDVQEGLTLLRPHYRIAPLSNGNVSLLIDLARFNDWRWDCILSCELAREYKPRPAVYQTAARLLGLEPRQVMMVAAHEQDLAGARRAGLRTAYVSRPEEYGPSRVHRHDMDAARSQAFDFYARDLVDLAQQMGVA